MSMDTMQRILCRGIVDGAFRATLLTAPEAALQEYDLSPAERAVLAGPAHSLVDLAQAIEAWRRGDLAGAPAGALTLAG
jgi:hypothetical protein